MNRYPHIFAPLRINDVVIRNRLSASNASPHFLQGPETFPAESYMTHVSGIAKNGAGILAIAPWDNYPNQRKPGPLIDGPHMQAFDMSDPSVHNYVTALNEDIHFYGAKVLISIRTFDMPRGYALFEEARRHEKACPRELFPEIIAQAVEKMKFYRDLDFDGVQIRADYYLQGGDEPRGDEYDGTVLNRARFFLETCREIKKALGKNFIIDAIVHGERPYGYYYGTGKPGFGYSLQDVIDFALASEGLVDILQLREQDAYRAHPLGFNSRPGVYGTIEYARALKHAGAKQIISVNGGYQDPDDIERFLADGSVDLVAMGRAFICDNEYVTKIKEGRVDEIVPCLRCNKCHGTMSPPWISFCSVNPRLGLAHKLGRMVPDKAGRLKRLAVVGGGPVGMYAALTAAQRGHSVTLYEKSTYLGGQLIHAESFSFKWPIKRLRDWLVYMLDKQRVDIRLNCAPSPEQLKAEEYDAVFVALGSSPKLPGSIKGLRDAEGKPLYPTCYDVFGREAELGKNVIMVGGSETGVETAMYLAENGHNVTVLTRQSELAHDASHLHYITWAFLKKYPDGTYNAGSAWEMYDNLKGIVHAETLQVSDNQVIYRDENGETQSITGDSIVICGGVRPKVDEGMVYSGCAEEFELLGDCAAPGNIQRGLRQAYAKAMLL